MPVVCFRMVLNRWSSVSMLPLLIFVFVSTLAVQQTISPQAKTTQYLTNHASKAIEQTTDRPTKIQHNSPTKSTNEGQDTLFSKSSPSTTTTTNRNRIVSTTKKTLLVMNQKDNLEIGSLNTIELREQGNKTISSNTTVKDTYTGTDQNSISGNTSDIHNCLFLSERELLHEQNLCDRNKTEDTITNINTENPASSTSETVKEERDKSTSGTQPYLVDDYLAMLNSFCSSTFCEKPEYPNTCCKPCSCEENCQTNCCFKNGTTNSLQYRCLHIQPNLPGKYSSNYRTYYMIRTCPHPEMSLFGTGTGKEDNSWKYLLSPVSSTFSNSTFYNNKYAACNGEKAQYLIKWKRIEVCSVEFHGTYEQIHNDIRDEKCDVSYTPPLVWTILFRSVSMST